MNLGDRIAHARKLAGDKLGREIGQSELARLVGVKPQSIQAIESGRVKASKITLKASKVLGVPVDWLDTGEGPTPTEASPAISEDQASAAPAPAPAADNADKRLEAIKARLTPTQKEAVADMLEKMFPPAK